MFLINTYKYAICLINTLITLLRKALRGNMTLQCDPEIMFFQFRPKAIHLDLRLLGNRGRFQNFPKKTKYFYQKVKFLCRYLGHVSRLWL